jgi:hypothetical protein
VFDGGVLAEKGSKTGDLASESGADVLRGVGGEVANAGHETRENGFAVDELGEACGRKDG